jgi:hypothetical protein
MPHVSKRDGDNDIPKPTTLLPFLTTPLLEDFGFLGNQNTIDDVLNGTYECPPEIDIYTKKFIHELQHPTSIIAGDSIIGVATTTEHIQGLKK